MNQENESPTNTCIPVLLCLKNQMLIEKIQGMEAVTVVKTIDDRDEVLNNINSIKFNILIIETAAFGEIGWLELVRRIPIQYRVLAFDSERLNQMLYGEMERLGVEFLDKEASTQEISEVIKKLQAIVEEIASEEDIAFEEEKNVVVNKDSQRLNKKLDGIRDFLKKNEEKSKNKVREEKSEAALEKLKINDKELQKIRKKLEEEKRIRKQLEKANSLASKRLKELESNGPVIKSVFKEAIAVYSPLSEGSSTVAAHLAVTLARAKKCRVCLIDFNPLKPKIKEIFDTNFDYELSDVLENMVKQTLSPEQMESMAKQSKYQKNLDLFSGLYDMNDYYSSRVEQYEEIIERLKFIYDYVIIDTHSWYDVLPTDAALRKADRVIVPVRGRKYSLEELQRYLRSFEKYDDFDTRKFGIVINQYSGNDLTSIEIGAKIKYPILGFISGHRDYHEINVFKNQVLMNEYVDILNALGVEAKKKGSILDWVKDRKKVIN